MLAMIALGGAVGSVTRYLLGGVIQRAAGLGFPVGTLMVNVTGSFVAGFLLPRAGLGVPAGILGSIIFATVGAVVLLLLIRVIKRA